MFTKRYLCKVELKYMALVFDSSSEFEFFFTEKRAKATQIKFGYKVPSFNLEEILEIKKRLLYVLEKYEDSLKLEEGRSNKYFEEDYITEYKLKWFNLAFKSSGKGEFFIYGSGLTPIKFDIEDAKKIIDSTEKIAEEYNKLKEGKDD